MNLLLRAAAAAAHLLTRSGAPPSATDSRSMAPCAPTATVAPAIPLRSNARVRSPDALEAILESQLSWTAKRSLAKDSVLSVSSFLNGHGTRASYDLQDPLHSVRARRDRG